MRSAGSGVSRQAAPQQPAAPGSRSDPPRPRALLVDDRADNLLALEAVLDPLDLDLVSVRSGAAALRELLTGDFAMIILDVQMPEMDGFETARLIKGRERTRHIPIIFLTAISGQPQHFLQGYESGAVDYVYKPFDPVILRAKVSVFAELWQRGRRIEEQAAELAARLDDLQAAYRALARQSAELERSNAALDRFAQVAAQDLLDPLHTVAGLLELLGGRHPLAPEAADLLDRARAGVDRMRDMVGRLLAYAREHAAPLDPVPVPLGQAVADACEALAPLLQAAGARVEVAPDLPTVSADRPMLVRLLTNLVDNAVRHSAGTAAVVEVSATGQEGGWEVMVRDHGPGIDAADVPRLLTVFARTTAGAPAGGLAACRRIAERHGGTLAVEPAAGGGTVVRVTLPAGG
jgi:signal transduction histidine kinase